MKSIFSEGKPQDIAAVLSNKDKRVAEQKKIFDKFPDYVLVDVNMNIPGPIKNNRYLEKLFQTGVADLESIFKRSNFDYQLITNWNMATGCENFYILKNDVKDVKRACINFEDETKLGRLFDADVLIKNKKAAISRKDFGINPRQCFICNRPAKECSRSRRHSVQELQDYISEIYYKGIEK